MKTKKTKVEGTLYVFAQAKSNYALENLAPGSLPFYYDIKSYDYGNEDAVRLHEFTVSEYVPDGIDITMKCVENLEEQIESVMQKADSEVANLRDRIKALALIEYKPDATPED